MVVATQNFLAKTERVLAPRHSPDAPGAIVLSRGNDDNTVDVVLDPFLGVSLPSHTPLYPSSLYPPFTTLLFIPPPLQEPPAAAPGRRCCVYVPKCDGDAPGQL
jgi:hypothetical protein